MGGLILQDKTTTRTCFNWKTCLIGEHDYRRTQLQGNTSYTLDILSHEIIVCPPAIEGMLVIS